MKLELEQFIEKNVREEERWGGIVLNRQGNPGYHLILLPGQVDDVAWKEAREFAEKAGGELPTRQEQSLLYANLKTQFKYDWYWSGEECATNVGYAWCQGFITGYQNDSSKYTILRARAVRRLKI